jgi:signal transduction histidine kinase
MATMTLESLGDRGGEDRMTVAAMLHLAAIPNDDWEASMPQILQIASQVLEVERVSYWSIREHPRLIHCDVGYVAGPRALEHGRLLLESDHPRYFLEIRGAGVIAIDDAQNDARSAELLEYLRIRKIASLLDVPVSTRGSRVGVLCHEHTGAIRHWTDSDIDFAIATAQTVAAALEARACTEAETTRQRTAFLDQSSLRLSKARNLSTVAQEAMALAVPEIADGAVLDVLNDGGVVRIGVAHRTQEGHTLLGQISQQHPPGAHGPHTVARVIRLRQSVLVPELSRARVLVAALDSGELRLIEQLHFRSVMAIPLLAGERVLGVMQFFGERRFDHGDLRFVEDLVERVAIALENARLHERADTAIRARDEFITVAAHELHGPLTSLQLSAESFAASLVTSPEASAKTSKSIVRQVQRLNRLVDHMLDASRIMTKRLSLTVTHLNLSKLVQEIAGSFAERCERAGSALTLRIEPGIVGYWDADRLAQVVNNLLDNAIKFGAGKPIDVSLQARDESAALTVTDRGIGVDPERLGSLFEPFVRAVSARSYGGFGLGLFMSKAIVDAHGGEIDIKSQPGEGSTLTVRLPRRAVSPPGVLAGDQK